MSQQPTGPAASQPPRHEPTIAEGMQRAAESYRASHGGTADTPADAGAESGPDQAAAGTEHLEETEPLQVDAEGPLKRHGDALRDGSGTRHGADATEPGDS